MEPHSVSGLIAALATVTALILLGSLFVAAEIALISLRESQIRQRVRGFRLRQRAGQRCLRPELCFHLD